MEKRFQCLRIEIVFSKSKNKRRVYYIFVYHSEKERNVSKTFCPFLKPKYIHKLPHK